MDAISSSLLANFPKNHLFGAKKNAKDSYQSDETSETDNTYEQPSRRRINAAECETQSDSQEYFSGLEVV